jgi:hypothetical protein
LCTSSNVEAGFNSPISKKKWAGWSWCWRLGKGRNHREQENRGEEQGSSGRFGGHC